METVESTGRATMTDVYGGCDTRIRHVGLEFLPQWRKRATGRGRVPGEARQIRGIEAVVEQPCLLRSGYFSELWPGRRTCTGKDLGGKR